jgi:hypothetical protein
MTTNTEDTADMVSKALRRAWQLGQTYWQQADSESYSANKRAEATAVMFAELVNNTIAALAQQPQPSAGPVARECDSPKLCAVQGACLGQYGTKKQCATAQPAPAAQPLTDEQAYEVVREWEDGGQHFHIDLVRLTERAHGIGATPPQADQAPKPAPITGEN